MACRALGKMGEKAPTTDVINRLVTALGDKNGYVRQCVCEVLGEMGEKAATNDVMNRLIAALGDENENVRQKASEALGEIGEKAATIDVITGLVTALGDENWNVSMSACDALGKMGEKAATNNVINGLVTALGNKIGHVRRRACEALGKIGEKAPNNDVINGLVTALWDADMSVRESACQVLGKMGEKAASNDVINGLLNARRRVIGYSSANEALEKILLSFSALTQLSSDTVSKLFENIKEGKTTFCRYATYQWAIGAMWQQYQLVILIHLRNLTKTRYPPSHSYSPVDLVKKEYFPYDELSNEDRRRFKGYYDKGQVLWILDGYDELVQDIPEQLKDIFDHVRNTQHHIMTSRPFAIALPYDIKLEITGFTNDNIQKILRKLGF
ncbi:unnamed protein product [Rotaria sp. Silwood1]|nr:unnamed protein product [Rotaria sp. Silwood1]